MRLWPSRGHRRRFQIFVPADITDPIEAVANSFGMTAEQYAQLQRATCRRARPAFSASSAPNRVPAAAWADLVTRARPASWHCR